MRRARQPLEGGRRPQGAVVARAHPDRARRSRFTSNRAPGLRRLGGAGFTLVELIVVMVLLLIVASLVAPRMSSFFRGRALNHEARRMLSLINYGQSRAVAEGVPVVLWIDPTNSTYGLQIQSGYALEDQRAVSYEAEPTLKFEIPVNPDQFVSESDDEHLGLPENTPAIRFLPDGFLDEVSVARIVIRQGDEAALELAPTINRLRYEIRPASHAN